MLLLLLLCKHSSVHLAGSLCGVSRIRFFGQRLIYSGFIQRESVWPTAQEQPRGLYLGICVNPCSSQRLNSRGVIHQCGFGLCLGFGFRVEGSFNAAELTLSTGAFLRRRVAATLTPTLVMLEVV